MSRIAGLAVAVAIWLSLISAASAQQALELLEKEIMEQLSRSGQTAENQNNSEKQGKPAKPKTEPPQPLERGYLGVAVDDREDRGQGVRVIRVHPGSPAEKAGLKSGDLIVALGGVRVRQMSDAGPILEQIPPGATLSMELLRGTQTVRLDVRFGRRPESLPPDTAPPKLAADPPQPEKPLTAVKPVLVEPLTDQQRIEALERRVEMLERRLEELERRLPAAKSP